jgi:hypothetical protein
MDNRGYLNMVRGDDAIFPGTTVDDFALYTTAPESNIYIGASNTSNFIAITPGKTIISNDLEVVGHFLPATDLVSDLGSADKRFKDLYMSGDTIHIGDGTISFSNGTVEVKDSTDTVVAPFIPDSSITVDHLAAVTGTGSVALNNNPVFAGIVTGQQASMSNITLGTQDQGEGPPGASIMTSDGEDRTYYYPASGTVHKVPAGGPAGGHNHEWRSGANGLSYINETNSRMHVPMLITGQAFQTDGMKTVGPGVDLDVTSTIRCYSVDDIPGDGGCIMFGAYSCVANSNTADVHMAHIKGSLVSSSGGVVDSGHLDFYTRSIGASNLTHQMRIQNDGYVDVYKGINTLQIKQWSSDALGVLIVPGSGVVWPVAWIKLATLPDYDAGNNSTLIKVDGVIGTLGPDHEFSFVVGTRGAVGGYMYGTSSGSAIQPDGDPFATSPVPGVDFELRRDTAVLKSTWSLYLKTGDFRSFNFTVSANRIHPDDTNTLIEPNNVSASWLSIEPPNFVGFVHKLSEKIGLHIDRENFVGIGTRQPTVELQVVGDISYSGTIAQSSDDRIKANEVFITGATSTLNKLRPQMYDKYNVINYAEDSNATSSKESGLIAQELFYDAPELRHLVTLPADADSNMIFDDASNIASSVDPALDPSYPGWGSNLAGVNYTGFIPYLIKAIQEKDVQITGMEARLSALEGA